MFASCVGTLSTVFSLVVCLVLATKTNGQPATCLSTKPLGNVIPDVEGDGVLLASNGLSLATGSPAVVYDLSTENGIWDPRPEVPGLSGQASALSADGTILAANFETEAGGEEVRVLQYSSPFETWNRLGGPITNDTSTGLEISGDGTTIAVSGGSGTLQMYRWNVALQQWDLLGDTVEGVPPGLENIAISRDGMTVAYVGTSSSVSVMRYDAVGAWVPLGSSIVGDSSDFGHSLALAADGLALAVGEASFSASPSNGRVHVYQLSEEGNWELKGGTIVGEGSDDNAGASVALSRRGPALVLAVGANGASGLDGRVQILVFDDKDMDWITLETLTVTGARFGSAVALTPDGLTLAANTLFDEGAVYVFSLDYTCPTTAPSVSPTAAPTAYPTINVDSSNVVSNLEFGGVPELGQLDIQGFEAITKMWVQGYFEVESNGLLNLGIRNVETAIVVTNQDVSKDPTTGEPINRITYEQTISYIIVGDALDVMEILALPFGDDSTSEYRKRLADSIPPFEDNRYVVHSSGPAPVQRRSPSVGVIIGIAVPIAAFVLFAGLGCAWWRRSRDKELRKTREQDGVPDLPVVAADAVSTTESSVRRDDEVPVAVVSSPRSSLPTYKDNCRTVQNVPIASAIELKLDGLAALKPRESQVLRASDVTSSSSRRPSDVTSSSSRRPIDP